MPSSPQADERYCFAASRGAIRSDRRSLAVRGPDRLSALKLAGAARRLGIYGFGAAAHVVTQVAIAEGREVYAFTRDGDVAAQTFARALGAVWAGPSSAPPPQELDAALIFAPAGALVPVALRATAKGATVVCGASTSERHSRPSPDALAVGWSASNVRSPT